MTPTREQCVEWAREAGIPEYAVDLVPHMHKALAKAYAAGAAAQKEKDAKLERENVRLREALRELYDASRWCGDPRFFDEHAAVIRQRARLTRAEEKARAALGEKNGD